MICLNADFTCWKSSPTKSSTMSVEQVDNVILPSRKSMSLEMINKFLACILLLMKGGLTNTFSCCDLCFASACMISFTQRTELFVALEFCASQDTFGPFGNQGSREDNFWCTFTCWSAKPEDKGPDQSWETDQPVDDYPTKDKLWACHLKSLNVPGNAWIQTILQNQPRNKKVLFWMKLFQTFRNINVLNRWATLQKGQKVTGKFASLFLLTNTKCARFGAWIQLGLNALVAITVQFTGSRLIRTNTTKFRFRGISNEVLFDFLWKRDNSILRFG